MNQPVQPGMPPVRVLVVTRNLPPLVGGMERLLAHVVEELARVSEVTVIGPAGCAAWLPAGVRCREVPLRPLWKFLLAALAATAGECRRSHPALLFAGSGLTAPITWLLARLCGKRCAVYLHGLDIIAGSLVYRHLWLPLIRRHDLCLVNSRYSRSLALAAGVREGVLRILNPGVELPPPADPRRVAELRRRLGLEDCLLLLSVGRLTERKGLLEFIRKAMPALLDSGRPLGLLVIGDDAADALGHKAHGCGARLRQAVAEHGLESMVRFLNDCPDETLAAAYAAADVLVFPVLERPGDAEGFGMVAIEAAAHGTPTVAFAVGGIPDAVGDGVSGILVPPGDYSGMAAAILRAASGYASAEARIRCREFAAGFRWQVFGERLRQLLALPVASHGSEDSPSL